MQARPRSSTLADALSRIVSRTSLRISLRIDRLPPPPTRLLGEHTQKEGNTVSMSAGSLIAIVYPAMRLINKQTAHVHVISFESELLRTSSAPRVMFCCVAYLPNIIVDVYVRTVSHSNPVFRYPAAYETADLGRPHQASTIRCKQISNIGWCITSNAISQCQIAQWSDARHLAFATRSCLMAA